MAADQNTEYLLSIRGMCKSFGRNRVLDHINLDVKPGTIMGLMGENGAVNRRDGPKLPLSAALFSLSCLWRGLFFRDGPYITGVRGYKP